MICNCGNQYSEKWRKKCADCRKIDRMRLKWSKQCVRCGTWARLDKRGYCVKCSKEDGTLECSCCGEILPYPVAFSAGRRQCRSCRRKEEL